MTYKTNFRIKFSEKSLKDFGATYPMLSALQEHPIQVEGEYLKSIGEGVKEYLDNALGDLTTQAARSISIEGFISGDGSIVQDLPAPTKLSVLKTYLTLDDFYSNLILKTSTDVLEEDPTKEEEKPKKKAAKKKATTKKKSTKKTEAPVVEETQAVEAPAVEDTTVDTTAVEAPAVEDTTVDTTAVETKVEEPSKAVAETPITETPEAPAAPMEDVAPEVDPSQIKVVEHQDPFKGQAMTSPSNEQPLMAGSLQLDDGAPVQQESPLKPSDLLQQALEAAKTMENYNAPTAPTAPVGIPQAPVNPQAPAAPQAPVMPQAQNVPVTPVVPVMPQTTVEPTAPVTQNPFANAQQPTVPAFEIPTTPSLIAQEPVAAPEPIVIEAPAQPAMTFAQPNYTRTENNSAVIDRIANYLKSTDSSQLEQTKTYLIKLLMEALLQPAPGLILEPGEEHQRLVVDHASILGAFDYIIHG